ncbi:MAG: hypothetical protein K2I47_06520, partial [Odoribacter sp.]|nr:hypothetical protein [Odoribacter sp.]
MLKVKKLEMKSCFFAIFYLLVVQFTFAAYDPTLSKYPYEYETENFTDKDGNEYGGPSSHNGRGNNADGAYISITIRDNDLYDLSCYDWYVETFTVYNAGGRPPKMKWKVASIGSINLNNVAEAEYGDIVQGSSGNKSYLQVQPGYKYLNIDFDDFEELIQSSESSLRIIVIKKSGGTCGAEEIIGEKFFEKGTWNFSDAYTIDFIPTSVLEITVPYLTVCNNDATSSVTASVTGITNPYTV